MNDLLLLAITEAELCEKLKPIFRIIGWVMLILRIAVPVILVVIGMTGLLGAMTSKDENEMKKAISSLVKKAVAGLLVFLIPLIITISMKIIGNDQYKCVADCVNSPTDCQ